MFYISTQLQGTPRIFWIMNGFILILTEQNRIMEFDDDRTLVIKKKIKHRAGATS